MAAKELPSQEVLLQLLRYEPETGKLYWLERDVSWFTNGVRHTATHQSRKWNSKNAGREAFSTPSTGYLKGAVLNKAFLAHRVIWKMVYGVDADHIDHISGQRDDNRLENLRNVSATGNARNMGIPSHNTSGVMGLSFDKARRQWAAYITLADRKKSIGRFHCFGQAIKARKEAERRHGFHANHGRAA